MIHQIYAMSAIFMEFLLRQGVEILIFFRDFIFKKSFLQSIKF